MNLLKTFEGRVSDLFGSAPAGYTAPFSFKRLAKRAAREMEGETFVIDGVDTAPGLYTILVSAADDATMRPLYPQLTDEISSFVEAQAQQKGYVFVAKPLTRFMVDPSLKSGKFAVFAENVDARTLERLREEERAFLSGSAGLGGAASQSGPINIAVPAAQPAHQHHGAQVMPEVAPRPSAPAVPAAQPAPAPQSYQPEPAAPVQAPAPVQAAPAEQVAPAPAQEPEPQAAPEPAAEPAHAPRHGHRREDGGVQADAAPARAEAQPQPAQAQPAGYGIPDIYAPAEHEFAPLEDPEDRSAGLDVIPSSAIDDVVAARAEGGQQFQPITPVPEESASIAPAPIGVPKTQRRNVPLVNPYRDRADQRAQARAPRGATCLLVDHQSGRTYTGAAPSTVIGRERTPGGIVLRDPNVSRQHAELSYDGRSWRITDLNSTNGTLVNDVDIETAILRDGDLITLGLTNLEFREN